MWMSTFALFKDNSVWDVLLILYFHIVLATIQIEWIDSFSSDPRVVWQEGLHIFVAYSQYHFSTLRHLDLPD